MPMARSWARFLLLAGAALGATHMPLQAQSPEAPALVGLPPGWKDTLDRLLFYGDFRFRGEGDWNRPNASDRWRARLRLRVGANYSVSDNLLVGLRLTTGPRNDARDSNATSGGEFSKLDLNLDRLFLTWNPIEGEAAFVNLGKFGHPFYRNPVFDEIVWYSDVQPEGVAFGNRFRDLGDLDSLRTQAAYYIFREESQGDIRIAAAEALASEGFGNDTRADFSLAWYGYENASASPSATTSRYQIVDAILGIWTEIDGHPWRFSAEGISNLASHGQEAHGWTIGAAWGSAQSPGDWRAYYQYQEIGDEAVFTPVAAGDFLIDHNFRGHVVNVDYVLTEEASLRLRGLSSKLLDPALGPGTGETAYRLRLDLNVKF